MGETSENDIYHNFRKCNPKMEAWISEIKEGQSAFDNTDLTVFLIRLKMWYIMLKRMAISIPGNIGIKLPHAYIPEMTLWQVKILFILLIIGFSVLERLCL